jgi:hypothetical protein
MESTKAKIQGTVKDIYDALMKAVPKDVEIESLHDGEEVEGFFGMFFTSDGSRGLAIGVCSEDEVLAYLEEVYTARMIAQQKGKNIVTSEDIDNVKLMKQCSQGT